MDCARKLEKTVLCDNCGLEIMSRAGVPMLFDRSVDSNHAWQQSIYDVKKADFDFTRKLGEAKDTTVTYMRHSWHCRQLGLDENSHVLDVGCLQGQRSWEVFNTYGCHVTGIDVSAQAIGHAEAGAREPLKFYCASAESLPFSGETFTHVLCFDVLEHLHRPSALIQEAHRVLRPGGKLFLHFPVSDFRFSFDWIWSWCRPEAFERNQMEAGHDRRFMPSSYNVIAMLAHADFTVEKTEWFNGFWQNIYDYHRRRYISEALFFSRYRISFDWYRKIFICWPKFVWMMDFPWRWLGCGGSLYVCAQKK